MIKFIAKLVLTIIFIPVFIILLLSVNIRFQFLATSFWQDIFTNDTYTKLSTSINKNLVSQTVAEGGSLGDVKILTDLISPTNLKDVIDKNINNVLQYANGSAKEIIVYLPVNKIPKSLLSKNFTHISEQMRLTDFLTEFNVTGISASQIQLISRVGLFSWIFLFVATLLTVLLIYLLYLCVNTGKRLIAPGLALIISGILALFATGVGTVVRINWVKDLAGRANVGDSLLGIIAPPIIQGVLGIWLSISIISIILGVILFFIKKPLYNSKSK